MTTVATTLCLVFALGLVLLTGIRALRNQQVMRVDLGAAVAVEIAVLFYVVVRVVDLAGGHETSGLAIVIAYLVGILLVMPVTVALGLAEATRWGSVVLGVGGLVVCVLLARLHQLWTPHG